MYALFNNVWCYRYVSGGRQSTIYDIMNLTQLVIISRYAAV